jgi:hypothetical protein
MTFEIRRCRDPMHSSGCEECTRAEAFEEAARVADELGAGAPNLLIQTVCHDIAGCIRALASKDPK